MPPWDGVLFALDHQVRADDEAASEPLGDEACDVGERGEPGPHLTRQRYSDLRRWDPTGELHLLDLLPDHDDDPEQNPGRIHVGPEPAAIGRQ